MAKLKIKLLAFRDAPDELFENAINRIEKVISTDDYILTDNNPDVLFFLSGGSELSATKQVAEGRFYLLIGSKHDNSYASATEVMAYMNNQNINSILLDEEEANTEVVLKNFLNVKKALGNLKDKRLGLIGEVSDWLISSTISSEVLDAKLGIKLIEIPWSNLSHYSQYNGSDEFIESFSGRGQIDLTDTSKVNELLKETIQKWNLDAITVECFPLVQKEGVTACLPLATFNDNGIPAGCEGDLTAISGMMLVKELTGIIPWIANINKVSYDSCIFSHCTIATRLVSNFTVKTHFETGKGSAIEGDFIGDLVTIFRLDNKLKKAFVATANIINRPKLCTACRTQIEVKLTTNDVNSLKENPLGNHHLVFPGDCKDLLVLCCKILNIDVQ